MSAWADTNGARNEPFSAGAQSAEGLRRKLIEALAALGVGDVAGARAVLVAALGR